MVRNIQVQNTFSGPLDLLLYLVRRDEIDIHDIPVGHVTKEYLVELNKMNEIDVDAGGEFLAMASMLTEIKGRMLLPEVKEDEEDEDDMYDPRQGLVEALLEYKKFKEVAAELEKMSEEFDSRYRRTVKIPEFQAVVKEKAEELGALDLLAAFQRIARKMLNERAPREIVSEEVPTEVRIQQIQEVVTLRGRVSFTSILSDSPSEDEMVGFFIAMLELIRMRKIEAQQSVDFSEIYFIAISESEDEEIVSKVEAKPSIDTAGTYTCGKATYIRRGRFGLSNAFGAKSVSKTKLSSSRSMTTNRYDMLGINTLSRSSINEAEVGVFSGMKFPPLFSYIKKQREKKQLSVEAEVMEFPKVESVVSCERVERKEKSKKKYRAEFKLSSSFGISSGVAIKQYGSSTTANKFNVLSLKWRSGFIDSTDSKEVNSLEFMRIGVGRICIDRSLPVVELCEQVAKVDEGQIDVEDALAVRFNRTSSMVLASPFGLAHIASPEMDTSSRLKAKSFDMLTMKRNELNSNTVNFGKNTLGFLRLSTGNGCERRSSIIDSNSLCIEPFEEGENEVEQTLPVKFSKRSNVVLANPFGISIVNESGINTGSKTVSRNFDMFVLKHREISNNAVAVEKNTLEFLPLGVGRVSKYLVAEACVQKPDNEKIKEKKSSLYIRNTFKLCSAFSMENGAGVKVDSGDPKRNKFDFMSVDTKKNTLSKSVRGGSVSFF